MQSAPVKQAHVLECGGALSRYRRFFILKNTQASRCFTRIDYALPPSAAAKAAVSRRWSKENRF